MARVEEGLPQRVAERADARMGDRAEPAGRSDVELDVVLDAARRHGATRVEFHGYTMYFDSCKERSQVYTKVAQVQRCQRCRTARQTRSATRNTAEAYAQRQAKRRQQQDLGATAKVGSHKHTHSAGAATASTTDDDRWPTAVAAVAAVAADPPTRPPGLAPASPPLPEQQQPEPESTSEPVPAPVIESEDEDGEPTIEAAAEAAATASTATASATTAASMAAGLTAGGAARRVAADEQVAGEAGGSEAVVDERRAEPAGAGKRQAVLATCVDYVCTDVDDEAAVSSAPLRAEAGAPSRAQGSAPSPARAGVRCEGRCAGGQQCGVWSTGSSAPAWVSAPLRSGARYCLTHEPRRAAARAAKAAEKAAAKAAQLRQPARGVRRVGTARRAAAATSSTAGMAAAIMAARRE